MRREALFGSAGSRVNVSCGGARRPRTLIATGFCGPPVGVSNSIVPRMLAVTAMLVIAGFVFYSR